MLRIPLKEMEDFIETCKKNNKGELTVEFYDNDLSIVDSEDFIVGNINLLTGATITFKP